jgi:hypothetical protein
MSISIPPPPGTEEGYDAIIAYFNKYSTEELEKAGHLVEPPPGELEELMASATFTVLCREGLHAKLSRKDYEQLSRLAVRQDVAVEDLVKRWIKERLRQERKQLVSGKKRSG